MISIIRNKNEQKTPSHAFKLHFLGWLYILYSKQNISCMNIAALYDVMIWCGDYYYQSLCVNPRRKQLMPTPIITVIQNKRQDANVGNYLISSGSGPLVNRIASSVNSIKLITCQRRTLLLSCVATTAVVLIVAVSFRGSHHGWVWVIIILYPTLFASFFSLSCFKRSTESIPQTASPYRPGGDFQVSTQLT